VEGSFLFCRSEDCSIRLSGSIKVWIDKLGILLWGPALINSLVESGSVKTVADIYRLEPEDLAEHCSGMKVATKCYTVLHAGKSMSLATLLSALNIPTFSMSTASDVVDAGHDTIDKVLSLSVEDLDDVPNIGRITAEKIYHGLRSKHDEIMDLMTVISLKSQSGSLRGLSFCITGSTSRLRRVIEKDIIDNGGSVRSAGSGLSYLITNETSSNSGKMQKAKKFGTKIISEDDLYAMLGFSV
jgi:DNA ligase (NAD+)